MSFRDYLCCQKCGCKIFYDENKDLADYLETYFEGQGGLTCPKCVKELERELAEALETSAVRARIVNKQTLELAEARAETISLAVEVGQAIILRSIDFAAGESVRPRDHAIWRAMRKTISERDEARAEIENKQYTITCASEENQQLKESLAEARAEIDNIRDDDDSRCFQPDGDY